MISVNVCPRRVWPGSPPTIQPGRDLVEDRTTLTYEQLLKLIVETAARVINASAGHSCSWTRRSGGLIVEHPLGPRAGEVDKLRVPLGHGIAGLVAVSGQPMSISDASHDPRQAADVADRVGYWPNMILCVPLVYGDRIIGVLSSWTSRGAVRSPRGTCRHSHYSEISRRSPWTFRGVT